MALKEFYLLVLLVAAAKAFNQTEYNILLSMYEDGDELNVQVRTTSFPQDPLCEHFRDEVNKVYKEGDICLDCKTRAHCDTFGAYTITGNCADTLVCDLVLETPLAVCASHSNVQECKCTELMHCDGYNPDKYILCAQNNEGPFISKECDFVDHVCRSGECIDKNSPAATTTEDPSESYKCSPYYSGFLVEGPRCQNGMYCENGNILQTYSCKSTEYFDPEVGCTATPPNPCVGCEEYCPDKIDCTKYYYCQSGSILSTFQCGEKEYFNSLATSNTDLCVATDDFCPLTSICAELKTNSANPTTQSPQQTENPGNSISTPSPSLCNGNSVGKTYSYEQDCKMYYQCVQTGAYTYVFILKTCWHDNVYNPSVGRCDYPQNVPTCVPTSTK